MSLDIEARDDNVDAEISTLITTLHATGKRLEELTGGEIDAVADPDGGTFLLRRAQDQLRRREAVKQAAILDALPAHVALLDARGFIVSVNQGWRSFADTNAGSSPEYTVGLSYLDICENAQGDGAELAHEAGRGVRSVLDGGDCFSIEYPCHSPLEQRWFMMRVAPLEDSDRGGAVIMHVNSTERRMAEDAMRMSESSMAAAQAIAHVGSWELDLAHEDLEESPLRWSAEMFRIAGYDPGAVEISSEFFFSLVPSEEHEKIRQAIADSVRQLVPFSLVHRLKRSDGQERILQVNGQVFPFEKTGQTTRLIGTAFDITERTQSQQCIAEQAALIDEARDAIFQWDLSGRIVFWSKGAERLYGWTCDEARGRLLDELLWSEQDGAEEANRVVLEAGVRVGEIRRTAKDGRVITVDARWTLVRDVQGKPSSILAIDTDITKRRDLERQFLRVQRMESIGTLAGGIAHDLNNTLSPIIMSLDLLGSKFPDKESQQLLAIISTSARRGADMVRQVLSFASGTEGRKIEVRLQDVVQDVEKIANDTFFKHITVTTIVDRNLWTVLGDPTQLHQVLLNLCLNARDAMPDGGTLTIHGENLHLDAEVARMEIEARPGPYVVLEVHDSGAGIPAAIVDKIFDPFFTTKKMGQGTGLGLSTSLSIVKSHGGFVRVESSPGKGTSFTLYLPAQGETCAVPKSEAVNELRRGHGELILVVDDESAVRDVTRRMLEAFGYRVLLAADGKQAETTYKAQGHNIAAVFTDMMMPVMDGRATIRALREINPSVRIIATCGQVIGGSVEEAAELGANRLLAKPYTTEALLGVLHQVLS